MNLLLSSLSSSVDHLRVKISDRRVRTGNDSRIITMGSMECTRCIGAFAQLSIESSDAVECRSGPYKQGASRVTFCYFHRSDKAMQSEDSLARKCPIKVFFELFKVFGKFLFA